MKTTLLLSASLASASALRGKSGERLTGHAPEIPPPDAACLQETNDAYNCGDVLASDGRSHCMWCQTTEDTGICISEGNARDVVELMGMPCPSYTDAEGTEEVGDALTFDTPDFDSWTASASTAMRKLAAGDVQQVDIAPPDAACFQKSNTEDVCGGVASSNGGNCMWCQTTEDSGICVSETNAREVIEFMGMPCPAYTDALATEETSVGDIVIPNPPDFDAWIASASTLRRLASKLGHAPALPPPDAACFQKSHTANVCGEVASSDRGSCTWCQTTEESGICVSGRDAKNVVEVMGVPCPAYADVVAAEAAVDSAAPTPPDFNCFHSAWQGDNAEGTCKESKAADDSPCVWCPLSAGTSIHSAFGACLSNNEALAADGKFGLECPAEIYVEPIKDEAEEMAKDVVEKKVRDGTPDVNCFKAAWVADNAETACGESTDKDGSPCVWCSTDGDAAGACLSKAEAGMADHQFGLTCPSAKDAAASMMTFDQWLESTW